MTIKKIMTKRDEFYLEPYDYISIRPDPFFSMQNTIKISGAVYYPGNYTILRPDENIAEIIDRAGGLRTNAYPFGSIFKRDNRSIMLDIGKIVKRPKSKSNISVRGGDEIIISVATNVIELRGEINAPGLFKFNPNTRVSDAIKLAGGLTENANKKQIFISFPNGTETIEPGFSLSNLPYR